MADTVPDLAVFVARVVSRGRELYRDLPWRRTTDPYAVLVSEVMLQQTQVPRVVGRWGDWLAEFPTADALAAAPLEPVLRLWQGLGYNRRAIALKQAAEAISTRFGGIVPDDEAVLRSLPGIGPATAAGVLVFAFDRPATYLETNVRAVFLHELFADKDGVPDREIAPLVSAAVVEAKRQGVGAREWYYALLDYGAYLKRTLPNPSRRSAHHTRQSRFEGSNRQKRAWLLRAVLAQPGFDTEHYAAELASAERLAGRAVPATSDAAEILSALADEGFVVCSDGVWVVG